VSRRPFDSPDVGCATLLLALAAGSPGASQLPAPTVQRRGARAGVERAPHFELVGSTCKAVAADELVVLLPEVLQGAPLLVTQTRALPKRARGAAQRATSPPRPMRQPETRARAAYCAEGTSFDDYLELLNALPAQELFDSNPEVSYAQTVASTWKASIEAASASAPLTGELLALAAHLAPDAIPRSLFNVVIDVRVPLDQKRLRDALNALARFSLASVARECG